MLDAPEPIYDFLVDYFRDHFVGSDKPLYRFERGMIFDVAQNVNAATFPMAYLEWGETGEVESYSQPEGYCYDLVYPLVVLTFQKNGTPNNAVFTGKTEDAHRPVFGIGDLVTRLMRKLWADQHTGRFADLLEQEEIKLIEAGEDESLDWWIINWTFSVPNRVAPQQGETEFMLSPNRSHRRNPFVRGTQINLKFKIFERDALT